MKTTTRILPLVFSVLLLLVFVPASARARSNPDPAPPQEREYQIRWKKDMGLVPIAPGSAQASTSACSAFFIFAIDLVEDKVIGYSRGSTSQAKEKEGYYVCNYSMPGPLNGKVGFLAGMGNGLLPKVGPPPYYRYTRLPYYVTDQWIGGTNSRPSTGWRRGFTSTRDGNFQWDFGWEMIYVYYGDDNPKPTQDSSSERGPSPILSRASSFAGAWRGKFGDGGFELVIQQSGRDVAGHLNINSVIYGIRQGRVDANNTLRFLAVRPGYGGIPDQPIGNVELVMDAGGTSFKGKILNVDTSGTLIAR